MRKLGGLVILSAFALTGCAAQSPATGPAKLAETVPSIAPAPISTEDIPTPATSAPTPEVDGMALFLKSAKFRWVGQPPADVVLIGAGKLACQQMHAGTPVADVSVVEPGVGANQNLAVAVAAQDGLCPETIKVPK